MKKSKASKDVPDDTILQEVLDDLKKNKRKHKKEVDEEQDFKPEAVDTSVSGDNDMEADDDNEESDDDSEEENEDYEEENEVEKQILEGKFRKVETRSSLNGLSSLLHFMSEEKKEVVRNMGFGGLLSLKFTNLDLEFTSWLVDNFDVNSRRLRVHGRELKITIGHVKRILGLNSTIDYVQFYGEDNKVEAARDLCGFGKSGKVKLNFLKEKLDGMEDVGEVFRLYFGLYLTGRILCPTSAVTANMNFLHALVHEGQLNWASYVLDCLVDGIGDYKAKKPRLCMGCLLFLQLFYCHYFTLPVPCKQRPSYAGPAIGYLDDMYVRQLINKISRNGHTQPGKGTAIKFHEKEFRKDSNTRVFNSVDALSEGLLTVMDELKVSGAKNDGNFDSLLKASNENKEMLVAMGHVVSRLVACLDKLVEKNVVLDGFKCDKKTEIREAEMEKEENVAENQSKMGDEMKVAEMGNNAKVEVMARIMEPSLENEKIKEIGDEMKEAEMGKNVHVEVLSEMRERSLEKEKIEEKGDETREAGMEKNDKVEVIVEMRELGLEKGKIENMGDEKKDGGLEGVRDERVSPYRVGGTSRRKPKRSSKTALTPCQLKEKRSINHNYFQRLSGGVKKTRPRKPSVYQRTPYTRSKNKKVAERLMQVSSETECSEDVSRCMEKAMEGDRKVALNKKIILQMLESRICDSKEFPELIQDRFYKYMTDSPDTCIPIQFGSGYFLECLDSKSLAPKTWISGDVLYMVCVKMALKLRYDYPNETQHSWFLPLPVSLLFLDDVFREYDESYDGSLKTIEPEFVEKAPRQPNYCDCGVYVVMHMLHNNVQAPFKFKIDVEDGRKYVAAQLFYDPYNQNRREEEKALELEAATNI